MAIVMVKIKIGVVIYHVIMKSKMIVHLDLQYLIKILNL